MSVASAPYDGVIREGDTVRALFDYHADEPDRLPLRANETVTVVMPDNAGWTRGRANGSEGWFPSNYVEKVRPPAPAAAAPAPAAPMPAAAMSMGAMMAGGPKPVTLMRPVSSVQQQPVMQAPVQQHVVEQPAARTGVTPPPPPPKVRR